jgi:hypothetical protein
MRRCSIQLPRYAGNAPYPNILTKAGYLRCQFKNGLILENHSFCNLCGVCHDKNEKEYNELVIPVVWRGAVTVAKVGASSAPILMSHVRFGTNQLKGLHAISRVE